MQKKNMKFRVAAIVLMLVLAFGILPGAVARAETSNPFFDVKSTNWFYSDVIFVYENNLFIGTSDTEFAPNVNMDRAMFVTVLGRYHGVDTTLYTSSSFPDVEAGSWYGPYVQWAVEQNIVDGYPNGYFGTNDGITREQMATLISRYVEIFDINLEVQGSEVDSFIDQSSISDWASNSVELMRNTGIIQGDEFGYFNPAKGTTRAEASTIYYRLDTAIVAEKEPEQDQEEEIWDDYTLYDTFVFYHNLSNVWKIESYNGRIVFTAENYDRSRYTPASVWLTDGSGAIINEIEFPLENKAATYDHTTVEDGNYTLNYKGNKYTTTNKYSVQISNGILTVVQGAYYEANKEIYSNSLTDPYALNYYTQKINSKIENDDSVIINKATEITEGISDDYEKARAIRQWVNSNITYDISKAGTNQSALEALTEKKAVCQGYARLTVALLRAEGIPAKYVTGNLRGEGHAWVEAYVDNRWVIMDANNSQFDFSLEYMSYLGYEIKSYNSDIEDEDYTIIYQDINVSVNGTTPVTFAMSYKNGALYAHIEDISLLLNGANAQFDVVWLDNLSLQLFPGIAYSGDRTFQYNSNPVGVIISSLKECSYTVIQDKEITDKGVLEGISYAEFKLDTLAELIGFNWTWDDATSVTIYTS